MDLRIFTEPQLGATYDQQLRLARTAEDAGFNAYFRSDHLLTFAGDGLPGPTDTWITLAGLARETTTIRLGTLVTSATFRHPGMLALAVSQVDVMSGGRVELGLGAGWFDREHEAFGLPFPSTKERFERLEEQLAIVTGLWNTPQGGAFDFAGRHFRSTRTRPSPGPRRTRIRRSSSAGVGAKTTPRLAASLRDRIQCSFCALEGRQTINANVDAACIAAGRDPATLLRSLALTVCCGRDEAELERRAAAIGQPLARLRKHQLAGTPTSSSNGWAPPVSSASAASTCRLWTWMILITWS